MRDRPGRKDGAVFDEALAGCEVEVAVNDPEGKGGVQVVFEEDSSVGRVSVGKGVCIAGR
jgi:hypothetical protein